MRDLQYFSLFVLLAMFTSCEIVGGIFKAGMGFGIFIVLAIAVFIVWLISRGKK
jgi:hypothetical protein